jgi:hypothetical protein
MQQVLFHVSETNIRRHGVPSRKAPATKHAVISQKECLGSSLIVVFVKIWGICFISFVLFKTGYIFFTPVVVSASQRFDLKKCGRC